MKTRKTFILVFVISMIFSFKGNACDRITRDYAADTTFIYDDSTAETGWGINPGFTDWIGNYFPLSQATSGILKSFDVYFINNVNGSEQKLSINVFNNTYQLIGSTSTFDASAGHWISVPSADIPFSGPFYVMVKWLNVPGVSHYLGLDINGVNASQDLERYYDGVSFVKLSDPGLGGSQKGVFLVRAHAVLNPIGIAELNTGDPVQVFPLPAGKYIDITANEDLTYVKMFDLSGIICLDVQSDNKQRMHLDLSGIPDGIYVLMIGMGTKTIIKKVSVSQR